MTKKKPAADLEERLARALEETRETIGDAHVARANLKDVIREGKALADRLETIAARHTEQAMRTEVDGLVAETVPVLKKFLDEAVKHTSGEFDKFAKIVTGRRRAGGQPSLASIVEQYIESETIPHGDVAYPSLSHRETVCPSCGQANNCHAGTNFAGPPTQGALSICEFCNEVSIFDFRAKDQTLVLRRPTTKEAEKIYADPDVQRELRKR